MPVDAPTGWVKTTLRPLLADYIGGGWGNDERNEDFSEPGAVIRGTDIPKAILGLTTDIPHRFHKRSNIKSRRLEPNDIIFEVSGGSKDQPVGRALFCSAALLGKIGVDAIAASFCKRLVVNQEKAVPRFLYYFLLQIYQDRSVAQWQVQSTGISNFQFEAFVDECEMLLPTIAQQRRIASILSAYDDLIENNTRRIAILEEMARRIYEEWFVRFRFPGHENVRMVETELGRVPGGWRVRLLGDDVELAYGKALKSEERKPGDVPVYGSSGIVGHHDASFVDGPGIIVGRKGNVGSVHWSDVAFYPIDTVYYVKTALPLHFTFFNLQRQNFLNNDAAVPGLNRNQAYALPLLLPDKDLLASFESQCGTLLGLARLLSKKNANLRATRDLLLPKLISGELDVSAMPEPEAAAA